MGPLVGDNFVRFLKGGALGIASCLIKRLKKKEKLIDSGGHTFILEYVIVSNCGLLAE